jgi:hypothetical protein
MKIKIDRTNIRIFSKKYSYLKLFKVFIQLNDNIFYYFIIRKINLQQTQINLILFLDEHFESFK